MTKAQRLRRWALLATAPLVVALGLCGSRLVTMRQEQVIVQRLVADGVQIEHDVGVPDWLASVDAWLPSGFLDPFLARLHRCRLRSDAGPDSIAAVARLDGWLNITGGAVDDALLETLGRRGALHGFFDTDAPAVTDEGLRRFCDMADPRVRYLYLHCPRVTPTGLAPLARLTNLHAIGLDGATIDADGLAALADLPYLHVLRLRGCRLAPGALHSLARFRALASLELDDANVTDADADALVAIPELSLISLWRTAVGDATAKRLATVTSLRAIFLDDTRVSSEGLAALRAAEKLSVLSVAGVDASVVRNGWAQVSVPDRNTNFFVQTKWTPASSDLCGRDDLVMMVQVRRVGFAKAVIDGGGTIPRIGNATKPFEFAVGYSGYDLAPGRYVADVRLLVRGQREEIHRIGQVEFEAPADAKRQPGSRSELRNGEHAAGW